MSCFTYERRGPDGQQPMPPARWPTQTVAQARRGRSSGSWRDLGANEDDAGLPETRAARSRVHAVRRTSGRRATSLADVLDDDEMTGGDFVRHVKQCIDLLRQIGDVAPDPETRARGPREAADACYRGVVAASSVAAG